MAGFRLKEDRHETENKCVRFPLPLIERIEEFIEGKATTFSSFVIQACDYALDNMEDDNIENNDNKSK